MLIPIEFDEVNAMLDAKNDKFRRKPVNGHDPLWRVSRKRTIFPAQHACCWYCGWHMIWGGNGVTENLMCSASRDWHCWNSFGFDGAPGGATRRVGDHGRAVPARRFRGPVRRHGPRGPARPVGQQGGRLESTAERRSGAGHGEGELQRRHQDVRRPCNALGADERHRGPREGPARAAAPPGAPPSKDLELPESIGELRQRLEDEFLRLAIDSPEFGDLMRQLVPEFYVYLVRLVDGGHPLPRAKVKLTLAGIVPDAALVPGLGEMLTRELTLDLFERPPQRERIRVKAVSLAAEHVPQRKIAALLTDEKPRQAAVQNALDLDRKIKEMGLTSPYVLVTAPPEDYPKLRRHKNPKYSFQPREGYERPAI